MAGALPQFRMDFLRPIGSYFELYFVFLMSSVGWCDCFLGALKAHEETSAHDYQGWLQARPIREDIKKHFDLVFMFIIPQIFRISQMQITSASEHIRKICAICVREKENRFIRFI